MNLILIRVTVTGTVSPSSSYSSDSDQGRARAAAESSLPEAAPRPTRSWVQWRARGTVLGDRCTAWSLDSWRGAPETAPDNRVSRPLKLNNRIQVLQGRPTNIFNSGSVFPARKMSINQARKTHANRLTVPRDWRGRTLLNTFKYDSLTLHSATRFR